MEDTLLINHHHTLHIGDTPTHTPLTKIYKVGSMGGHLVILKAKDTLNILKTLGCKKL